MKAKIEKDYIVITEYGEDYTIQLKSENMFITYVTKHNLLYIVFDFNSGHPILIYKPKTKLFVGVVSREEVLCEGIKIDVTIDEESRFELFPTVSYPNGLTSWIDTHGLMTHYASSLYEEGSWRVTRNGLMAFLESVKKLTTEFEQQYAHVTEWEDQEEDWDTTVYNFLTTKNK